MNRLFNQLGRTVGTTISLYVNKWKSKFMQPQKLIKKLTAQVRKSINSVIRFAFGKPKSIKDYFHVGETYVSKMFLARFVIVAAVLVVLWLRVGYPYLNGRLWSAKMIVNTNVHHEFSGKGSVYYEEGKLLYKGEILDGAAEGKGELYDKNGMLVYKGDFSKNRYNGEGELYNADGSLLYRGNFLNNEYNGEGELFYPNGETRFYGQFVSGSYLEGEEYYQSGRKKYAGTFENGLYSGEASMYSNDIENHILYTGFFSNGTYEGEGRLYQKGDLIYKGSFSGGLYSGEGTLYQKGIAVYEGGFLSGKKNGNGRKYSLDGKYLIYEGEFKDNLYDGTGRLYDKDTGRIVYEGEFLKNIYEGEGELYGSGQKLYTGRFYNGEIDYLQYSNADADAVQQAFGNENELVLLDSSYLLVYKQLGVAFELAYVDTEQTPKVERIRLWGNQNINGISKEMTLLELKDTFEEEESYTEYTFEVSDSEMAVLAYLPEDIKQGDTLYSIKYIFDDYYIRVYSKEAEGKICYFEIGGV